MADAPTLHAITRDDGLFYTTTGNAALQWRPFPKMQLFQSRAAARRRAKRLAKMNKGARPVRIALSIIDEGED